MGTALLAVIDASPVSQSRLAREAGVSSSALSRYLHAQAKPWGQRSAQIVKAAKALGLAVPDEPWAPAQTDLTAAERMPRSTRTRFTPPAQQPDQETPVIPSRTDLEPADLAWFGLVDDPFDLPLPADKTWTCGRTEYVDQAFTRAVRRQRIVAIVGDVGAGKTTLLRRLHWTLEHDPQLAVRFMTPGNLDRASLDEGSLSAAMLRDLGGGDGYTASAELRGETLRRLLAQRRSEGEHPVLVIDEAHRMSNRGLIAVKELWDSFTFEQALSVVLVGQLALRIRMETDPRLKELTGRSRIVELPRLREAELASYLNFRMQLGGRALSDVFDRGAMTALIRRHAVYPLWIDAMASQAMAKARQVGSKKVTAEIVRSC